ncbi:platelet-derived growth factor receptor alpha-like [Paramacrobiotus metropolitanus]|uniref:platelet-derived growth factor receptor alpha-like n=1 Tax=Paramacrobiotus metropolitanus TaxID=2943436 RepID=UPI002445C82C|nr:platelet-derived growth factor receptor alpha-like [Paramacrobiotus metropolitanus]XP_055345880.1 platelet-derived growth factor receptor alpha-like [Paramacrobiotus metropolitanus]
MGRIRRRRSPSSVRLGSTSQQPPNSQSQGAESDFDINVQGQISPPTQLPWNNDWPPPQPDLDRSRRGGGGGGGGGGRDRGPALPPWMWDNGPHDHQNDFDRNGEDPDPLRKPVGGVSITTAVGLGVGIPLGCFVIVFFLYKIWPKKLKTLPKFLRRTSKKAVENHLKVSLDLKIFGSAYTNPHLRDHFTKLAIDPSGLQLSETILGRGEYGIVSKGFATGLLGYPPRTMVAVKALLYSDDNRRRKSFLNEIEMMLGIGRHLNIVNLLGIVAEAENPKLLLEYCAQGSLKSYLRKQKDDLFYNHVASDGELLAHEEKELYDRQNRATNTASTDDSSVYTYNSSTNIIVLSTQDLLSFCYQICRGLEFLASQWILHRDIAARNVLVTDRNVVKISDFGMAKQCQSDIYVLETDLDGPMPVKWMAPEAVLQRRFSEKSDVWSFGVLTCEIFSLGRDPYPDSVVKGQVMEFVMKIRDGFRITRPVYYPADIFNKVANRSWEINPNDRPTFQQLRQILENYVPLSRQTEYLELNQEYETFNHIFGMTTHNAYVDLKYENIIYDAVKY